MKVTNDRLDDIATNSNNTVHREEIRSIAIELRKWRCLLPGEPWEEEDSDRED